MPAWPSIVSAIKRIGPPSWPMVLLTLCSWHALLAVLLGKDLNWDLLNYHFYNGYALLTGRINHRSGTDLEARGGASRRAPLPPAWHHRSRQHRRR
jgi:hypothetical protein